MDAGKSLAVIIVNWNVRDYLRRCLHSLDEARAHTPDLRASIWVVDNASSDGSATMVREAFPHVHLLALEENVGFARGNNLALRALGLLPGEEAPPRVEPPPDAVFFLNPDTEVTPNALSLLVETLYANPRTGVVGPRLVYGDGSHQHSAFEFPGLRQVFLDFFPLHGRLVHSRINGRYSPVLYAGNAPFPVDFILGAAMLMRREVITSTGGFDEGYWLYCEEMDWARRIRAAGWEIRVDPRALIVHHEGRSSRQFRERAFVALWRSRFRYFAKYHTPEFNRAVRWIVRLGLWRLRREARYLPPAEREARVRAYAEVERLAHLPPRAFLEGEP